MALLLTSKKAYEASTLVYEELIIIHHKFDDANSTCLASVYDHIGQILGQQVCFIKYICI